MLQHARSHRPLGLLVLVVVLLVIAIGGLATGPQLIADPTGARIGADQISLARTPIDDWAPVGWFLIVVMGVIPLVIAWGLTTRHAWRLAERIDPVHTEHWSWLAVQVMGAGLLVWLGLQLALIDQKGGPQSLFGVLGAVLLVLPWLPSVRGDLASR
ncbi:MAG: hypothetical protein ACXVWF_05435 [Actinomycetota bacterium]